MTRRLKLIKHRTSQPVTVAEIAAMEFAAVKEFRGLTKVEGLKKLHGVIDDVRALVMIASEIVAMDKPALVAKVDDKLEQFGPFLMQLAHGRDQVRVLMEFIGTAEVRLAVALAVIEGDQ